MKKNNHFNTSSNSNKEYKDNDRDRMLGAIRKFYKSLEGKTFVQLTYKNKYTGYYTHIEIPEDKYSPEKYPNVPFIRYKYKNGNKVSVK